MKILTKFFIVFTSIILSAFLSLQVKGQVLLNKDTVNICKDGTNSIEVVYDSLYKEFHWQIDTCSNQGCWASLHLIYITDDSSAVLNLVGDTVFHNKNIRCLAIPKADTTKSDSSENVSVFVFETPSTPSAIIGDSLICSDVYKILNESVTPDSNTYYHWFLPDWTLILEASIDSSSITFAGKTDSAFNIAVVPKNPGCTGTSINKTIHVVLPITGDGFISGTDTICYGMQSLTFTADNFFNATSYDWSIPDWASFTGNITDSSSVTINGTAPDTGGNFQVSVIPQNGICGPGKECSKDFTVIPKISGAGSISGSDQVCAGNQQLTYTVAGYTNAAYYTWTIPSNAMIESSNADSSSISFTWNAAENGTLTATPINLANCPSAPGCSQVITVNPLPLPSDIIEVTDVCKNQSDVAYEVDSLRPGYIYSWSLRKNLGDFEAGQYTNKTFIHWGNNDGDDSLFLMQTIALTQCSINSFAVIHILPERAPDKTAIIRKAGSNMLVCADTSEGIKYQWGTISKSSNSIQFIDGATLRYVFLASAIDTNSFNYFVDTYIDYAQSVTCTTRSYLNPYTLPIGIIDFNEPEVFPIVYPNPSDGNVVIRFPGHYHFTTVQIGLYDLTGRLHYISSFQYSNEIQLSFPPELKSGLYLLRIYSPDLMVHSARITILK